MLAVISGETGGTELGGVVRGPRGYCLWHWHCRVNRIGGRYRSDFDVWLDETRAGEKGLVDVLVVRPSDWYRHDSQDLWEALNGVRELPSRPARVPWHPFDAEPDNERRLAPPSLVREVFGSSSQNIGGLIRKMLDGEWSRDEVLKRIAERMDEHTRKHADEEF